MQFGLQNIITTIAHQGRSTNTPNNTVAYNTTETEDVKHQGTNYKSLESEKVMSGSRAFESERRVRKHSRQKSLTSENTRVRNHSRE